MNLKSTFVVAVILGGVAVSQEIKFETLEMRTMKHSEEPQYVLAKTDKSPKRGFIVIKKPDKKKSAEQSAPKPKFISKRAA